MGGFFSFWLRVLAVVLGAAALLWQPGPEWIENAYANGAYPGWSTPLLPSRTCFRGRSATSRL